MTKNDMTGRLAELLSIPANFINQYSNLMKQDLPAFINFLKTVKSSQENKEIYLLGKNNTITGIQESYMPREVYFKTFEDIMNMKDYQIQALYGHGNDLHIQTVCRGAEFNIANDKDEFFHPGFSFDSTEAGGVSLGSYLFRLICTNGMISRSNEEVLRYENPADFYEGLGGLMKNDFVSDKIKQNIIRARNTTASLDEVNQAREWLRRSNETVDKFVLDNFIPLADTRAKLDRNKLDINSIDRATAKNIPTENSVWDVINGVTDFASHDYRINVNDNTRIQLQADAGKMLGRKTYDTQNLIILK